MDFKWIGVVISIFIGLTLICNVLEGTSFITLEDRDILEQQGMTQDVSLGFISIPIPGLNYITGIIRILDFKEYNDVLFTGMGQIIYFALCGITFLVGFFLFVQIISLGVNAIRGR